MDPNPNAPQAGDDNSRSVMIFVGCAAVVLLMLCLASGGLVYFAVKGGREMAQTPSFGPQPPVAQPAPQQPSSPAPLAPGVAPGPERRIRATVSQAMGSAPAPVGSTCEISIGQHQRQRGAPWCRANVICAGQLLYGGGSQGYFNCQFVSGPTPMIVGQDTDTTSSDGDAAFRIDTTQSVVEVRDNAPGRGSYSITAQITSLQ